MWRPPRLVLLVVLCLVPASRPGLLVEVPVELDFPLSHADRGRTTATAVWEPAFGGPAAAAEAFCAAHGGCSDASPLEQALRAALDERG